MEEVLDVEFKFDNDEGRNWGMVEKEEDVVGSADWAEVSNGEDNVNEAVVRRLSCAWVATVVKRPAWDDIADLDIMFSLLFLYSHASTLQCVMINITNVSNNLLGCTGTPCSAGQCRWK